MENPGFYAILPASVRYDNRLKPAEKIFYAEITALANQAGYCYAGNSYFSQLYGVDERTVRRWVQHLQQYGYADVSYAREGNDNQRRISPLTGSVPDVFDSAEIPDINVRIIIQEIIIQEIIIRARARARVPLRFSRLRSRRMSG
nr:MAG TPA: replisome organizer protein [Caudoviricetes sp.]